MENATKALIMVGVVFLAILILSIGIYLKGHLGNTAESYINKLDTVELQKYNSNFEVFNGRVDITAQEIVTLINIIKPKELNAKIFVNDGINNENYCKWSGYNEEEFLSKNILKRIDATNVQNTFKCIEIKYDEQTNMVCEIRFIKN